MRKTILNYKEKGTSIVEENDNIYFQWRGKGKYIIPLKKLFRKLYENNSELTRESIKEATGVDIDKEKEQELTPEIMEKVKKKLRKEKLEKIKNHKNYMSKWLFMQKLWKTFHDKKFSCRDVMNNVSFPKQEGKEHFYQWVNKRLTNLRKNGYLTRSKEEGKKHYMYYFREKFVEKFSEEEPLECDEAVRNVHV